ncbi:MAG: hypothetical protein AAB250_04185, partial [Bdellovibrionota bacterium]
LDLKCLLFVPDNLDQSKRAKLESLGAVLKLVETKTAFAEYAAFISSTGIRKFDQFGNANLRRHYSKLTSASSLSFDVVIGTVGTGLSLLGIGDGVSGSPTLVSTEPDRIAAIPGIRNVRLEHFGASDPCNVSRLTRVEVSTKDHFPAGHLETDSGPIEITDTFRVVLGGLEIWSGARAAKRVFAVGAANRRAA